MGSIVTSFLLKKYIKKEVEKDYPNFRDIQNKIHTFFRYNGIADELMLAACEVTGAEPLITFSRRRGKKEIRARQLVYHELRFTLGMSYGAIGKMFGYKDHGSVRHACIKISEWKKMEYKPFLYDLEEFEETLDRYRKLKK